VFNNFVQVHAARNTHSGHKQDSGDALRVPEQRRSLRGCSLSAKRSIYRFALYTEKLLFKIPSAVSRAVSSVVSDPSDDCDRSIAEKSAASR